MQDLWGSFSCGFDAMVSYMLCPLFACTASIHHSKDKGCLHRIAVVHTATCHTFYHGMSKSVAIKPGDYVSVRLNDILGSHLEFFIHFIVS